MSNHTIGIYSGALFDYLAPDPELISLETICVVLGRIPRFGGHTTRAFSVAEHVLRVDRLAAWLAARARLWPQEIREVRLAALLHDAHEAYTPWGDCMSPGKTEAMRAVEAQIDDAIRKAFGLGEIKPAHAEIVKQADILALYWEATLWAPHGRHWAPWLPSRPVALEDAEASIQLVFARDGEDLATEIRSYGDVWTRLP